MNHTPGPWEVSQIEEMACVRTVEEHIPMIKDGSRPNKNARPFKIAICYFSLFAANWYSPSAKARTNARLIAAAPDLLEACEAIVRAQDASHPEIYNDRVREATSLAEAAVTKARGA